jgi:hypothetical protein
VSSVTVAVVVPTAITIYPPVSCLRPLPLSTIIHHCCRSCHCFHSPPLLPPPPLSSKRHCHCLVGVVIIIGECSPPHQSPVPPRWCIAIALTTTTTMPGGGRRPWWSSPQSSCCARCRPDVLTPSIDITVVDCYLGPSSFTIIHRHHSCHCHVVVVVVVSTIAVINVVTDTTTAIVHGTILHCIVNHQPLQSHKLIVICFLCRHHLP